MLKLKKEVIQNLNEPLTEGQMKTVNGGSDTGYGSYGAGFTYGAGC